MTTKENLFTSILRWSVEKAGYKLVPAKYEFFKNFENIGVVFGIDTTAEMSRGLFIENIVANGDIVGVMGAFATSDKDNMKEFLKQKFDLTDIIEASDSSKAKKRGRPAGRAKKSEVARPAGRPKKSEVARPVGRPRKSGASIASCKKPSVTFKHTKKGRPSKK